MADVQSLPGQPDSAPPPRLLDRQGWPTLAAGALLLLISFTTNYGNDNLSRFRRLPAHEQIGMGLHLAALAALVGDVQLASRLRHRDAWTREREAYEAARARRTDDSPSSNPEWMPCCSMPIPPRRHLPPLAPTSGPSRSRQHSANQADGQLLEIGVLAAIGHHQETADQHQNSNGCRE